MSGADVGRQKIQVVCDSHTIFLSLIFNFYFFIYDLGN